MNKEQLKKEFEENFLGLRKIINSWGYISGSPNDEFDALNHKLLNLLYKEEEEEEEEEKVVKVLQSELTVYYGLYTSEFDSKKLAKEIYDWWYLQ